MRKILIFFFLVVPSLSAEQLRAPVFSRNQVLNQFIFYGFTPLSRPDKNRINLDLAHTNVIRIFATDESQYHTWSDMELTQLTLQTQFQLSTGLELSLNVGAITYWGGFLDHLVEEYHEVFGFPNGQHGLVENYSSTYILGNTHNIVAINGPRGGLRDTSLQLRYEVLNEKGSSKKFVSLSLAAAIEFPTGKTSWGLSNGSLDWGLALYLDSKPFKNEFYFYGLLGLVSLGEFKDATLKMPLHSRKAQLVLGGEWQLKHYNTSLLLQTEYSQSPYKKTNNPFLDSNPWNLLFGANFKYRNNELLQVSFTEDLNHKTTPDFTFQLCWIKDI